MKSKILHFFPLAFLAFLNGCTQKEPAQVDYFGKNYYGKSGIQQKQSPNAGFIIVKPGDTLLSLSNKHKVSYDDLLKANNLSEDNILRAGQKLRLPNKKYHKVLAGETLSKIAKRYNISTQSLAEINNIEEPYTVKIGELISIPVKDIANETVSEPPLYNHSEDNNDSSSEVKIKQIDAPDIQPSDEEPIEQEQSETPDTEDQEEELPKAQKEITAENQDDETSIKPIIQEKTPAPKSSKFIWPIKGALVSNFGPLENGGKNDGVNIEAPANTPIKAAANGVVVYSGNGLKGYGNLVILKHADGTLTAYAHQKDLIVSKDEKVKQGQVIGHVGSTGNVSSPQLHFAVRQGKKPVDPLNFLPTN